jgi:hypothetical protein
MYFAIETRVPEEVFCGQKFTHAPRCSFILAYGHALSPGINLYFAQENNCFLRWT